MGSKWQRGDALCGRARAGPKWSGTRARGLGGVLLGRVGTWAAGRGWVGPRGKINWAARRGKEQSGLRGVGLGLLLGLGFVGFSSLFISKLFYF